LIFSCRILEYESSLNNSSISNSRSISPSSQIGGLLSCRTEFRILFVSSVLVLAIKGGDKVDEDDAGVVGDEELIVESVVLLRNLTVGVCIG